MHIHDKDYSSRKCDYFGYIMDTYSSVNTYSYGKKYSKHKGIYTKKYADKRQKKAK